MTREHAKAILHIIAAFAEGKEVLCNTLAAGWEPAETLNFESDPKLYRIKPERKSVPMTREELPPIFWVRGPWCEYPAELVIGIRRDGTLETNYTVLDPEDTRYPEVEYSADGKIWNSLMKEVEA